MSLKGLGRSFDSLIPTELIDESLDPTAAQDHKLSELQNLKIAEIEPNPDQPRRTFDDAAIEELSLSIAEHGVIQPIIVTPKNGKYQIVAGERRFRAAKKAGLQKIPALVRSMDNQHQLEVSLIENLQRKDLNILETATAYLKLRDQFNLSLEQIGKRVGGKSGSAVSNTLRLLRLPEEVRLLLRDGKLTEGQARPLVGLEQDDIKVIIPKIIKEEWSARKVEQFIASFKTKKNFKQKLRPDEPHHYAEKSQQLTRRFSTSVQIHSTTKGAGKIIINFKNGDEFDRITKLFI